MSGGFSFPPPPPPPPRAAPSSNSFGPGAQYGPVQVGGGRGRGRGGQFVGGGGFGAFQGQGNCQPHGHYHGSGSFQQDPRTIQQNGHEQNSFIKGWSMSPQLQHSPTFPPGAFVNPAFAAGGSYNQGHGRQSGYNLSSQALFSNIAGLQQSTHVPYPGPSSSALNSSPPQFGGQKRKRDFPGYTKRGSQKPNGQIPPAVPSFGVPIPLPPRSEASSAKNAAAGSRTTCKTNQLGLTPGADSVYYDNSEDDQDEEDVGEEFLIANHAGKLMFEHNGSVATLSTPAEVKSWIEERRQRWPTRKRTAEKLVEARKRGEERKRLMAEAADLRKPLRDQSDHLKRRADGRCDGQERQDRKGRREKKVKTEGGHAKQGASNGPETELEVAKRALADQMRKVEELERKIAQSEAAKIKKEAPPGDAAENIPRSLRQGLNDEVVISRLDSRPCIGQHQNGTHDNIAHASVSAADPPSKLALKTETKSVSNSTGSGSGDSSDLSSDSSPDVTSDADSDAPPEETSSRPASAPSRPQGSCFAFVQSGYCKFGHGCRYKHELPVRGQRLAAAAPPVVRAAPNTAILQQRSRVPEGQRQKPKSLYQRLVEQERDDDDKLALQVIKHLGAVGLFRQAKPNDQPGEKAEGEYLDEGAVAVMVVPHTQDSGETSKTNTLELSMTAGTNSSEIVMKAENTENAVEGETTRANLEG